VFAKEEIEAFYSGAYQYFYKPLSLNGDGQATSVAVLLLNQDTETQMLHFNFEDVPNLVASSQVCF
jgi:hypothetical protein